MVDGAESGGAVKLSGVVDLGVAPNGSGGVAAGTVKLLGCVLCGVVGLVLPGTVVTCPNAVVALAISIEKISVFITVKIDASNVQ